MAVGGTANRAGGCRARRVRDELTRADYAARMDWRISAETGAAMRAAKRRDGEVAIVEACAATEASSTKAGALLDAVSGGARRDMGFALCRLRWLVRHNEIRGRGYVGARGFARGSATSGH